MPEPDVLSPDELRDAWPALSAEERAEGLKLLPRDTAEDLFFSISPREQVELILARPQAEQRSWVRGLAPDDAADLVQEAPTEFRDRLLGMLDDQTRREVQALLAYREDHAGGLMNPRFARLRPDMTVDEAVTYLRRQTRQSVEMTYYAYVLDSSQRLLGVVSFRELITATAMGYFEHEIDRAVVLALFVPLIISSGGNSGSQATSLVIRAMALGELRLRDWFRVIRREFGAGLALGSILGAIGLMRILLWQAFFNTYGEHYLLVGLTVASSLIGVVTFGTLAGSLLPFLLRRLGFDPASASAPFVATLVDVTGLIIYFTTASAILRGTLL